MGIKLSNNANATLAASITSSSTSITVTSGQGARFPTLSAGDYFYATLIDTSNNLEIVKCTARSTDVLTVTRAQESTTARAYSAGDRIELRLTAQTFIDATTVTPAAVSDQVNTSTGAFDLPSGTTAERPGSPSVGYTRYNTTLEQVEVYDGATWQTVRSFFTATGGTTVDSGGYRYHKFTSSGTFQVTKGSKAIEYLIIAGGGAGGHRHAGGGGAGGVLNGTVTATVQSYSIVVGAGGAKRTTPDQTDVIGANGSNSTGFGLTAIGGGGGGSNGQNGADGGSGGGDGERTNTSVGGAGTSGQGFAGGGTPSNSYGGGGGGGGAAGVGANGPGNGTGGAAADYTVWATATSSGVSNKFAGGGGAGGYQLSGYSAPGGGGGAGAGGGDDRSGVDATANTGSGGGGGGQTAGPLAGSGGSGIVIIRYTI